MSRNIPAFARDEPDQSSVQGAVRLPYRFGAQEVRHAAIELPIPVGYWRSVGHSYNAFFVESFMDELAIAAKTDPLTFRLRHLEPDGRHARVLKLVAEKSRFKEIPLVGEARGLALHESFGSVVAQVVHVRVDNGGGFRVLQVDCAIDCGEVIHPDTVVGQMEGSIIFALSAALTGQISFQDGEVQERNFDTYPLLSLADTPEINIHLMPSTEPPQGVGEPGVPPLAPALANAIYAASGRRVRRLPISRDTAA